ncbi:MAG: transglutaminaseTgpA domain-containing protein [Acidimicrobiales bacterium]
MMPTRRRGETRRMPATGFDALAELSLVIYSGAIVFGFSRLFVDGSYFVPIAASAASSHVLAAAVRWARGGLIISTIVSLIGLVVTAALLFPPTTIVDPERFLDRDTFAGFRVDIVEAFDQFQRVAAPADATAEFLLLIAVVMWVVAFLSDWAAFRLRAPVEALIPGAAVFIFGALFAADQNRIITAAFSMATALFFVLMHRLGETSRGGAWLGAGAAARAQTSLARTGVAILAATIIGGVAVAQVLPGFEDEPILDISELDAPDEPRVVLSPLVDIRSRLIDQPDVEVFTVESPERDYWRITSLDVFDGRIWRSRGSFDSASGPLDTDLPDGTSFESVSQTFTINKLGGIWLPAAYEPAEVLANPSEVGFEYERESGTLIVDRDVSDSDGLSYTILSAVPVRDPEVIAAAGSGVPGEIRDRYLDLPDDFSERVATQAEVIVAEANATTPYEKALALQNWFRGPLFSYDLDVSSGHSSQRLEDFLFEIRVGYCEQFSGSYAAMARAIGLPARVAVGFTPGEFDASINAYRVTGKHAHAWPEVWIENIGWLRFEPTPGRGAPGDEIYTEQAESQASNLPGNAPTTAAPINPNSGLGGPDATNPEEFGQETTTTRAPSSDRAESGVIGGVDEGITTRRVLSWGLAALLLVLLAFFPLLYGIGRAARARSAVAHDPRRRIGLAWRQSRTAMAMMGLKPRDSETPNELVDRAVTSVPMSEEVLREMAHRVTSVTYSDSVVPEAEAARAEALASSLAAAAREHAGTADWWWQHASPLNVWRDRQGTWGDLRPKDRLGDAPDRDREPVG